MVEPIKLGLIGVGTVADYGHLPAITDSPGAELVVVADISRRNLKRAREKFGVRGTLDYHKLLAMEETQAVSICTPVNTHRQIAQDALAAGKHVFCEKPLAATEADCEAIVEAAADSDRIFAVDFHLRLSEDMLAAKKHLDDGDIGDLQVLRFIMNWGCHGTQGEAGKRRANFMRTGGPMLDNGVHFFDLTRWLSGAEVEKMTAQGQWVEEEFEYPGHVISVSRLTSGVLALVEMSFVYGHLAKDLPASSRMEIIGSQGVIADGRVYTPQGRTPLPRGGKKRFDRIYAEFFRCVREETMSGSTMAGAIDGARATQASLKAISLALENRPSTGPPSQGPTGTRS